VLNPYKRFPIYNLYTIDKYRGRRRNEVPPHIFAIADGVLAAKGLLARRSSDAGGRLRLALALGLFGLIAQNLFDRNLLLTGSSYYLWLYLGLMAPSAGMPAWPDSRGGPGEASGGVLDWRVDGDDLVVTLNARQTDGPTTGAKALLAALGVAEKQIPLVPVIREATIIEARRAVVA